MPAAVMPVPAVVQPPAVPTWPSAKPATAVSASAVPASATPATAVPTGTSPPSTAPTPPPPPPPRRTLVLDTAALIAATDSLFALGGLVDAHGKPLSRRAPGEDVAFVLVPDVAREARDPRARARLALLAPFASVREPAPDALDAVIRFAKATGDYPALSRVDLQVLALARTLEVEGFGMKNLREAPQEPVFRKVTGTRAIAEVVAEEARRAEEEEVEKKAVEEKTEGWVAVERARNPGRRRPGKKAMAKREKAMAGEAAVLAVNDVSAGGLADGAGDVVEGVVHNLSSPAPPTAPDVTSVKKSKQSGAKKRQRRRAQEKKAAVAVDGGDGIVSTASAGCTNTTSTPPVQNTPSVHATSEAEPAALAVLSAADAQANPIATAKNINDGEDASAERLDALLMSALQNAEINSQMEVVDEEEDDGVGWINCDNLEEQLAIDSGGQDASAEDENRVGCVTTDFAMQNVLLQMGINLVSVDGRRVIKKVRRYVLRCQSCTEVTRELERLFCGTCGNSNLTRVTFDVDKEGVARLFLSSKFKPRLRGTKYPIPMPRGGRNSRDLILCEDQIDPTKLRRAAKERERRAVDVLDPDTFYKFGGAHVQERPLVVGYGARNPNEGKPSTKVSRR